MSTDTSVWTPTSTNPFFADREPEPGTILYYMPWWLSSQDIAHFERLLLRATVSCGWHFGGLKIRKYKSYFSLLTQDWLSHYVIHFPVVYMETLLDDPQFSSSGRLSYSQRRYPWYLFSNATIWCRKRGDMEFQNYLEFSSFLLISKNCKNALKRRLLELYHLRQKTY